MRPTYTLEDILGTQSRIAVLRLLYGVRVPLNASQIAERVHLTRPAVTSVLEHFADMGIVRSSSAGRANVHLLERENVYVQNLVAPLFEAERGIPDDLLRSLSERFTGLASSVVLFGSYARGDQQPSSDVDAVFVAENQPAKAQLERAVYDYSVEFRAQFGASLSPIVYERREAADLPHSAPALYDSLVKDELLVFGLGPREWPHDRQA